MPIPNNFVHPDPNMWGRCCNSVLNSHALLKLRRATLSKLPFLKLQSDVQNVVYLNWLVDLEAFEPYIPEDVHIKSHEGRTLFTILTYNHKHFGPVISGPLRQCFPSPLQSNWRLYLDELPEGTSTEEGVVLFLKNILNNLLYTAGSRLVSDALPSHLAQSFQHTHSDQVYVTNITGGQGSAPALFSLLQKNEHHEKKLPDAFMQWFGGWDEALDYICLQKSAVAHVADIDGVAHAGIELPIDVTQVVPLQVKEVHVPFLDQLNANPSEPFAFVVPQVDFKALWERLL